MCSYRSPRRRFGQWTNSELRTVDRGSYPSKSSRLQPTITPLVPVHTIKVRHKTAYLSLQFPLLKSRLPQSLPRFRQLLVRHSCLLDLLSKEHQVSLIRLLCRRPWQGKKPFLPPRQDSLEAPCFRMLCLEGSRLS